MVKMNEIKLNGESKDIVSDNISKIKEIFPEVITEDKIDFKKLELILGEDIDDSREKYSFTWPGKTQAIKESQKQSTGTLRPCREESKNWDTTQNLYIEGDNLEVLKLLQKGYYNKIKAIYIDPPYNTGKDFIYKDNYQDNLENYLKLSGQLELDETTNTHDVIKLSSNPETAGRYHSNWLNMMYPRLKLARNLLTNDGLIFISIDDNELENLKRLCDEIFGIENYINLVNIKSKASSGASGGGEDKRLKKNIEYLLIYSKSNNFKSFNPIYKNQNLISYIEERRSENKSFAYTKVFTKLGNEEYIGETKDGSGEIIELYNIKGFEIKSIKQLIKEENATEEEIYYKYFDRIFTTENAQTSIRTRVKEATSEDYELIHAKYVPISGKNKGKKTTVGFIGPTRRLVSFLKNVAFKQDNEIIKKDKIGTLWDDMSWSSVHLEGGVKYNNGKKPIGLIKRILNLQKERDYTVLDFFSGSASTAHAVMDNNAELGTSINFIMVQIPEEIPKDEKKSYPELNNICDIGEKRINISGDKIIEKYGNNDLDIGFKVFKLDSSNLEKWDPDYNNLQQSLTIDNIKEDRTNEDLIYEIMLKYGIDLTYPIQQDENIYSIGYGALVICLDNNVTKDIADKILNFTKDSSTSRVVFKDSGFASDADKTNIKEILKINNIDEFITI